MQEIAAINQKIVELKAKKEQLRTKSALLLYRKLEGLLGKEFTPELVLAIVSWSLNAHGKGNQEVWRNLATSFQRPRAHKNTSGT